MERASARSARTYSAPAFAIVQTQGGGEGRAANGREGKEGEGGRSVSYSFRASIL